MVDIVVGEADCCQESDLCSSSDRETSCIVDDFDQGNQSFVTLKNLETLKSMSVPIPNHILIYFRKSELEINWR